MTPTGEFNIEEEYTVTITPTENWYALNMETEETGAKGASVSYVVQGFELSGSSGGFFVAADSPEVLSASEVIAFNLKVDAK